MTPGMIFAHLYQLICHLGQVCCTTQHFDVGGTVWNCTIILGHLQLLCNGTNRFAFKTTSFSIIYNLFSTLRLQSIFVFQMYYNSITHDTVIAFWNRSNYFKDTTTIYFELFVRRSCVFLPLSLACIWMGAPRISHKTCWCAHEVCYVCI